MSHGTEHHLEHAEHAQHQAHDPFDRRVAITMAIMAAVLAGATLASHRGHTETLLRANESTALRTEAGGKRTDADTKHTQANDQWSFYQAKNIRSHQYQSFLLMAKLVQGQGAKPLEAAIEDYWIAQVDRYEGDGYWAEFQKSLEKAKEGGKAAKAPETKGDLAQIQAQARELTAEAEKLQKQAREIDKQAEAKDHEGHALHGKVTWIDMGHLGLELALVFCAVAMLRKQRPFWITGIVIGAVGAGLAVIGIVGWITLGAAAAGHH